LVVIDMRKAPRLHTNKGLRSRSESMRDYRVSWKRRWSRR